MSTNNAVSALGEKNDNSVELLSFALIAENTSSALGDQNTDFLCLAGDKSWFSGYKVLAQAGVNRLQKFITPKEST